MISRRTRKDIRVARQRRALARTIKNSIVAAACGLWTLVPTAMATPGVTELPTGGQVTKGTATINTQAATMNINQTSDRAIIDWNTFNIGKDATVNFNQTKNGVQNTAAMTLNRVTGSNMSEIYGKINSIGSVILVNPSGIMFAAGSEVNAAGIVASTAGIDEGEFYNNGKLKFSQAAQTNKNITVDGSLNAAINGDYLATGSTYAQSLAASSLNIGDRQVVKEISTVGNKIMLVADGDIAVGTTGAITATTITNTATSTSTTTEDGFTLTTDVAADRAEGTIILRADQNADDVNESSTAATITLNNDQKNFQGVNVKLYYNDEITAAGVNGTTTASIGITGAAAEKFTMKNYASGYGDKLKAKVADTVTTTENTAGSLSTSTATATTSKKAYSLINDVYQLQAIDDQNKDTYLKYNYALGGDIDAADTANWTTFDSNKGFDPIGLSDVSTNRGLNYKGTQNTYKTYGFPVAFKGEFTGNGGTGSYSIYDLNIDRKNTSTLNYIGLFAVTYGATITDLAIVDPVIAGYYDIGSVVGYAINSKLENLTARKRVAALDGQTSQTDTNIKGTANMGGIVGTALYTSIRNCVNSTKITGTEYIGGIAGSALNDHSDGSASIDNCINKGYYSPNETVTQGYGVIDASGAYIGGLAGIIGGFAGETTTITNSYSNGQVHGKDYVGGLIGRMDNGIAYIKSSYNSNETEPGKTTIVTEENAAQSIYGQVVASGATAGGIIGAAGAAKNSNPNITIEKVYNSGNVTAKNNAGGIVGYFGNGTLKISNSYNADNNTVLLDANNYAGFKYTDKDGNINEYVYDSTTQKWYKAGDTATEYSEKELEAIAPMNKRRYNTRLAYRDATVTTSATGAKAGGIIGYAGAGVTLVNTYSAGRVYDKSTNTTKVAGGLVGQAAAGATASGTNFYITEQNVTGAISGDATKAVNSGTLANAEGWTLWKAQNTDFGDSSVWYYSPGSTTPLLRCFMTGTVSAGKTQYVYDGSAHLVDTSSFASYLTKAGYMGYYGNGAFSTGADGDNFGRGVNVKNSAAAAVTADNISGIAYGTNADGIAASADDNTTKSSFYSYALSNLWSPQHGYMTDASRGLVITPKKITYDVTKGNEKTYGDAVVATDFGSFTGIVQGDEAHFGSLEASDYLVATDAQATAEKLTDDTDAGEDYILKADTAAVKKIIGADAEGYDASGNYYLASINDGTITINQREITYTIGSATKTYGETTLDSLTGSWSDNILAKDAGDFVNDNIIEEDNAAAISSALSSSGINKTAGVAGNYTDLKITDSSVFNTLITNKNYKLKETGGVTIGTSTELKVTPREVTYAVADKTKDYGVSDTSGYSGTFTDVLTGTTGLVNGDEAKVNIDSSAYKVAGSVDTDATTAAGTYKGAITISEQDVQTALGDNYTLKGPVTPGSVTVKPLKDIDSGGKDITPNAPRYPDMPRYDDIKGGSLDPQPKSSRSDLGGDAIVSRRHGIIGGIIPDESRYQIRFLTVIDSGINIGAAPEAIEHITIDASSYAADSDAEQRLKK